MICTRMPCAVCMLMCMLLINCKSTLAHLWYVVLGMCRYINGEPDSDGGVEVERMDSPESKSGRKLGRTKSKSSVKRRGTSKNKSPPANGKKVERGRRQSVAQSIRGFFGGNKGNNDPDDGDDEVCSSNEPQIRGEVP